ncbi:MAG: prenyltransferase, partial [Actinomycetota bacterium]
MARTETPTTAKKRGLLWRWAFVMRTCNPPPGPSERVDVVSKWLVLVRACVFPLTVTSAAIGGLLAVGEDGFDPWLFGLAGFGLLLAHAANNLMNDLFDLGSAIDTKNYPRALYAPHPVLSGLISKKGLGVSALVINAMSLAVMLYLTAERGWPIVAFALAGFIVSGGYAAPPLRLKKRGLGEPGVLIV